MTTRRHDQASLDRAATIIAALDSPLRIDILLKLHEREHVVHELVSSLSKSQPLVSQHLRVLKKAGVVDSRRSGREVSYRLAVPETIDVIDLAARLGAKAARRQADDGDDLAARRKTSRDRDRDRSTGTGTDDHVLAAHKAAIVGPPALGPDDMPGLVPKTPEPPSPTSQ